jgi:hypothetical protein
MHLKIPILKLLGQLQEVLERLTDQQYTSPVPVLSNASIGQHMRHIIEFFLELNKGYKNGVINYDQRNRDHAIESERMEAITKLRLVSGALGKENKRLLLIADLGEEVQVHTNYYRELIYNLEHIVHHMALIRVGITAISTLPLPADFGVAISTLKYRKTCAQ